MSFLEKVILIFSILYTLKCIASYYWMKKHPQYGITFVAAPIGAGKSCYSAKVAQKHIKKGWKVYSNDYIKGCYKITIKDLETLCAPPKSLIILDETSLDMNSRNFAKTQLTLIEYFKKSRHYENKLILISQTFGDTDKQIRELASKILFIRPLFADDFVGLLSMPVKVKGKLGIAVDGQPAMQYEIGRLGIPYLLPRYYKYFNSFSKAKRDFIKEILWDIDRVNAELKVGGACSPEGGQLPPLPST